MGALVSNAIRIKKRVYHALITRYIVTKYGRDNLGFIWIFIEPMILCVGVMGVWSISKGKMEHGLHVVAIVYTGYMPLTLWRHLTGSMAYVLRWGKYLTNFRHITHIDVVISRIILEFTSVSASAIVVFLFLNVIGVIPDIYSLSDVMIGWIAMSALGLGGGLLIAGATEASEITEKFIQPVQYLMIPFSGCFFLLDWLPSTSRDYLLYVPFIHCYEIIRGGFFGPLVTTYGNPYYPFAWSIILIGAGFVLLERVRDRIEP